MGKMGLIDHGISQGSVATLADIIAGRAMPPLPNAKSLEIPMLLEMKRVLVGMKDGFG